MQFCIFYEIHFTLNVDVWYFGFLFVFFFSTELVFPVKHFFSICVNSGTAYISENGETL